MKPSTKSAPPSSEEDKITFIDKQKRAVLGEGRNYGVGFAFCERDGNTVATIMPISSCKDYLNDVIWSEVRDKEIVNYGLVTKKLGLFENTQFATIAFKVCGKGASNPQPYPAMDKDIASYKANRCEIEASMNVIEERLGLDHPTRIIEQDGVYIATISLWWCKATYRISLWSLLVRALRHKSDKGDPIAYLATVTDEDQNILNYGNEAALKKLKRMIAGCIPEQDLFALNDPHDIGINRFPFPYET